MDGTLPGMGRVTQRRRVLRVDDGVVIERPDTLAVEEPLEIRVGGRPVTVTMRTPGHDIDLAIGFLVTEGLVARPSDVTSATACADNVVDVTIAGELPELSVQRNFYTTSSCGMCGKASIDAVRTTSAYDVAADPVVVEGGVLVSLPARLREAQRVFDRTGGLHAAGLFTADGELLCLREDVGRHNAVDKVVGWAVPAGRLPAAGTVLQVSGRASFELVQKAVMAGIPVLAAVSAPSSLAVELAEETGLTLVGFLRGTSYNVYAGAHRLAALGVRLPSARATFVGVEEGATQPGQ
jgi:FdhD protein